MQKRTGDSSSASRPLAALVTGRLEQHSAKFKLESCGMYDLSDMLSGINFISLLFIIYNKSKGGHKIPLFDSNF